MRHVRWLESAAVGTWTVCGLPAATAIARAQVPTAITAAWIAAFVAYGLALLGSLHLRESARRTARALVAVESVAAIIVTTLIGRFMEHTGIGLMTGVGLLVVVAAQLPYVLASPVAGAWIAVQTTVMTALVSRGFGVADVLTFGLGSAGFQMFACLTTLLMLREQAARGDLARVNAELQATRAALTEHTRAGERLRIARDLHDSLGHHLTALSLQLDVASRLAAAPGASHVSRAHAITRLLLAEVRSVVGVMRDSDAPTDIADAVRALAVSVDALAIHVDMPERLAISDPRQAQSLLRCVQEIVTNTARHAHARNLWIAIGRGQHGLELRARDDGRGQPALVCGNGLQGMRERFAEYSGTCEFETAPGSGFAIHAFMPTAEAAS